MHLAPRAERVCRTLWSLGQACIHTFTHLQYSKLVLELFSYSGLYKVETTITCGTPIQLSSRFLASLAMNIGASVFIRR